MRRVVAFTNILPPYRVPLFQALAGAPGLDFRVLLLAKSEENREWSRPADHLRFVSILPGVSLFSWRWDAPIHLNRHAVARLSSFKPEVVVLGGWDQPAYWEIAYWCRKNRVPFVLQNESSLLSARHLAGPWRWIKGRMVRWASSYVAYGTKAREYLEYLGAPRSQIFLCYNTVDVAGLAVAVSQERSSQRYEGERARYPGTLFLYVGQLIPRKGLDLLLQALAKAGVDDAGLVVVGSGPEEGRLRNLVNMLGLRNVMFVGFRQPDALAKYYALADALVLPSRREVWGLVVNEALASGLYVICSDRVGAAYDLLIPDWNGETFPDGDVDALAHSLQKVHARVDQLRARRPSISHDACRRFDISQEVRALLDGIAAAYEALGGPKG